MRLHNTLVLPVEYYMPAVFVSTEIESTSEMGKVQIPAEIRTMPE